MEQKAVAYLDGRTENDEDAKEKYTEPMSGLKKNWQQKMQSSKLQLGPEPNTDQASTSCSM